MDTEDEEWLNAQSRDRVSCLLLWPQFYNWSLQPLSPQHFEAMMDKLEQGSGNTVNRYFILVQPYHVVPFVRFYQSLRHNCYSRIIPILC